MLMEYGPFLVRSSAAFHKNILVGHLEGTGPDEC